jgi:ATP-dependent DNA helicase RecG
LFGELLREAKRWLEAPSAEALAELEAHARALTGEVPPARREDWEKLLAGFANEEPEAKRRARVEGLARACKLFRGGMRDFADACDALPGLGPAAREALAERGIETIADLLWTLPVGYDDLRAPMSVRDALAAAPEGGRVCVVATARAASVIPMRGRRSVRVLLVDDHGDKLEAWWFFAAHGVLQVAKAGTRCLLLGKITHDPPKSPRMAHPDLFADSPGTRGVRPRYPRLGVAGTTLRKAIGAALDAVPDLPDPVPASVAARERMSPAADLLRAVHGKGGLLREPPTAEAMLGARDRLAWTEAFARIWERFALEENMGDARAPALPRDEAVLARLRAELGFSLTESQRVAIEEISADLASTKPMRRLLLGDVGTGKTAVAMAAVAQAIAAGRQAAVLAPTSVLAEQYMDAVAPLARATGKPIALVAAGQPAQQRRRTEAGLASGAIAVAIGTHALLSGRVEFDSLGLVIVDEQHRLGVAQRLALVSKGRRPHLLALSATPIPRTLALAIRGDLATSKLVERPGGRPPVATETRGRSELPRIVEDVRAACARGERVYFVCPRIEADADSDEDPSTAAVERAAELARLLAPTKVALVHGALGAEAKRRAMRAFRAGEAPVLVGTTVVEVGLDVPEATLMVVDEADRFGLAQLHQLRGRVGRGARQGRCVLLHREPIDQLAARRLEVMVTTSDGAEIARADLALRGAGDLWGTRQSGEEEELLYLDPARPPAWLAHIEQDAREIFAKDRALSRPEHRALALARARFAVVMAVREEAG